MANGTLIKMNYGSFGFRCVTLIGARVPLGNMELLRYIRIVGSYNIGLSYKFCTHLDRLLPLFGKSEMRPRE